MAELFTEEQKRNQTDRQSNGRRFAGIVEDLETFSHTLTYMGEEMLRGAAKLSLVDPEETRYTRQDVLRRVSSDVNQRLSSIVDSLLDLQQRLTEVEIERKRIDGREVMEAVLVAKDELIAELEAKNEALHIDITALASEERPHDF